MKKLAIVIVTYNSEADIYDCLESIAAYSDLPKDETELIIVDNNSRETESMFAKLRQQWGESIVLIRNKTNGGYGQGNNLGIRSAASPVVLVMNPDVRLCEPVFVRALRSFEKNPGQAVLGMVQMFTKTKRSNHSFCPTWLINGYLLLVLYALCNRFYWYLPSCMYAQGSCFFVDREKFLGVGGFDETNFMYGEEEDLHYRLKKRYGKRCFSFDKTLHYLHLADDRAPSLAYEKKIYEANVALYAKKGVDESVILRHFLQCNRLLLLKAWCKSKAGERHKILKEFREYLLARQTKNN